MWKNNTNSSGLYGSRFSYAPWTCNEIRKFLCRICTKRKKPQCSSMQQLNGVLQPAYSPLWINTTFKICFVFSFVQNKWAQLFCFMPGLLYSFIESLSLSRIALILFVFPALLMFLSSVPPGGWLGSGGKSHWSDTAPPRRGHFRKVLNSNIHERQMAIGLHLGSVSHGRRQPARREQWGLDALLRDTSTLS